MSPRVTNLRSMRRRHHCSPEAPATELSVFATQGLPASINLLEMPKPPKHCLRSRQYMHTSPLQVDFVAHTRSSMYCNSPILDSGAPYLLQLSLGCCCLLLGCSIIEDSSQDIGHAPYQGALQVSGLTILRAPAHFRSVLFPEISTGAAQIHKTQDYTQGCAAEHVWVYHVINANGLPYRLISVPGATWDTRTGEHLQQHQTKRVHIFGTRIAVLA